jgi:hypothetical protein
VAAPEVLARSELVERLRAIGKTAVITLAGPVPLIEPPKTDLTTTWTPAERRAKKQRREAQRLRFCTAIPWEFLPGSIRGEKQSYSNRRHIIEAEGPDGQRIVACLSTNGDLVLASGEVPDQEADPDDKFMVEFPIKFATWKYLNGLPTAPLSCDPRRTKAALQVKRAAITLKRLLASGVKEPLVEIGERELARGTIYRIAET